MLKEKTKKQKELLDKILMESFGKNAVKIGDLLYGKKNVNEFLIAKKLDLTINQTRNLLYKMAESGLVLSIRKKDKKKGWYTYFWTLDIAKSLDFLKNTLDKKLKEMYNQVQSRETRRFYYCSNCHTEYSEESALMKDFICGECGRVLELKDNSSFIQEKKKEAGEIEKELIFVNEELMKERGIISVKRGQKEKREKKKKEKERAVKRALMKRERDLSKIKSKPNVVNLKHKKGKVLKKKTVSKSKKKPKKRR